MSKKLPPPRDMNAFPRRFHPTPIFIHSSIHPKDFNTNGLNLKVLLRKVAR